MTIHSIIPLLAAFIYIILLLVLIINRPWQRQHKLFLLYLAAATVWGLSEFLLLSNYFTEYRLISFRVVICSSIWWVVQLYIFARAFLNLKSGFGIWFGYASLALLCMLAILDYAPPNIIVEGGKFIGPVYGWWFIIYVAPLVILAGLGGYSLWNRFRVLTSPEERNKISYLIVAVSLLVVFGFLGVTPIALAGGFPLSHIGGLISACVLAYAILKHELVSINYVLRRGLGVIFVIAVGIGIYGLILYLLHWILDFELTFKTLTLATLSGTAVAVLVYWLRPTFFSMIDQFFYRETYSYRRMIQSFDREMGNIISLDELAGRMLSIIAGALRTSQAKLLFQNVDSGDFTVQYTYPKTKDQSNNEPRLVSDNPIISWLEKETSPLNLAQIGSIAQFEGLWQTERDLLANSGLELLCPIKSRGKLIGILALGKKLSNNRYSHDDIEMIVSMAGKAGIIIENARMFNILRQQQYQVQQLLSEAIHAQESERQRISIDLHDSVAQWLAGASYQTQTVEALLSGEDSKEIKDELANVENTIEKSLKELRRVVVDLRPPALDELGLNHALQQSLADLSSDGVTCNFSQVGTQTRLQPGVEITVYRAVQEALTNIRKHAEASKINLNLQYEEDKLLVKVSDNGKGFDLAHTMDNAISVGNVGLLGMKQRVEMLGGKIDIRTKTGGGTIITMNFPIQPQVEER
jgi:signal transduction histidine kinase